MTFILVLLFWAAIIGYVPFHFRQAKWVRSFYAGFSMIWYCLATATEPNGDEWIGADGDMDAAERGAIAAVISIVIVALTILVFAGYTLVWAW